MAVLFLRVDTIGENPTNDEISKFLKHKSEMAKFILCAKHKSSYFPKDIWRLIAITLCWGVTLKSYMDGMSIIDYYKFWLSHAVTRKYNPFIYNQKNETQSGIALLLMYTTSNFDGFNFGHPFRSFLNTKRATAMCKNSHLVTKSENNFYEASIHLLGEILIGIVDNPDIITAEVVVTNGAGSRSYCVNMKDNIAPVTLNFSVNDAGLFDSFPILPSETIRPLSTFVGREPFNRVDTLVFRFTAKKPVQNIEIAQIFVNPEYFKSINAYSPPPPSNIDIESSLPKFIVSK